MIGGARPRPIGIARWAGVVVATTGLLLALISVWTEPATPGPELGYLYDKFQQYPSVAARTDIVFVGTSRIFRGVSPAHISQGLAGSGCDDLNSYNFGFRGMSSPLAAKIIDFVLPQAPRIQYVFIEVDLSAVGLVNFPLRDRAIFFNQYSTLPLALLQLANPVTVNWPRGYPPRWRYLTNFAVSGSGMGRLGNALFRSRSRQAELAGADILLSDFGFQSLDTAYETLHATGPAAELERLEQRRAGVVGEAGRAFFARQRANYRRSVRDGDGEVDRLLGWYLDMLVARAVSANTRPGIVFSPVVNGVQAARQASIVEYFRNTYPDIPILRVSRDILPELYGIDMWFDRSHLNARGAAVYSTELGRQLCAADLNWAPR